MVVGVGEKDGSMDGKKIKKGDKDKEKAIRINVFGHIWSVSARLRESVLRRIQVSQALPSCHLKPTKTDSTGLGSVLFGHYMRPLFNLFWVHGTTLRYSYYQSATISCVNSSCPQSLPYCIILVSCLISLRKWRESLGGPPITYSETDFITPRDPDSLLPYTITPSGRILPFRSGNKLHGGHYPGIVRDRPHSCIYETHIFTGFIETIGRRVHPDRRPRHHTQRNRTRSHQWRALH